MQKDTQTWHYGLIARWWAEFNEGGPELPVFEKYIEEYGEPVLDAGCGTGRLLIPLLSGGMRIDGSDASPDMLDWCKKKLAAEDLKTHLYSQSMHQLDLPNRYRSIINCGAFGLGGGRDMDMLGLRRVFDHLMPGGALIFDYYLPNFSGRSWMRWLPGHADDFPREFPAAGDRRTAADGTELELRSRTLKLDPLNQFYEAELKIDHYQGDELLASETARLHANIYFMSEIQLMLKHTGFTGVRVRSGKTHSIPRAWEDPYIIFIAERPM